MTNNQAKKHTGSCHCGAVKIEVIVDASSGTRCNCSVCTKLNTLGAKVKPDALKVISGESELSTYVWGAKIGTRYFCKHCGVHVFGRGHLAKHGGDFASVNLQALDDVEVKDVTTLYWDGRHDNWEAGPGKEPYPIFRAPSDAAATTTAAR
jgi:hypothetical protein